MRDRSSSKAQPLTLMPLPSLRQLRQNFETLQSACRCSHVQPAGAPIFIAAGHSALHLAAKLSQVCALAPVLGSTFQQAYDTGSRNTEAPRRVNTWAHATR